MDAQAVVSTSGSRVLVTKALSITTPAKLDMTNNDMVIDYSASHRSTSFSRLIDSARNAGRWNGTESPAQHQTNPQHNTTLARWRPATGKSIVGNSQRPRSKARPSTPLPCS